MLKMIWPISICLIFRHSKCCLLTLELLLSFVLQIPAG
jgi:hypothetical protein